MAKIYTVVCKQDEECDICHKTIPKGEAAVLAIVDEAGYIRHNYDCGRDPMKRRKH